MKLRKDTTGFTVVELMIATMVFGILLLVASAAIITIGRQFYKGIVTARTQSVAQSITEDIVRGIQFSRSDPRVHTTTDPNLEAYCIGDKQYIFKEKTLLTSASGPMFLVRNGCEPAVWQPSNVSDLSGGNVTEMLGENMRVSYLDIQDLTGQGDHWAVSVKVVYGADDIVVNPDQADAGCASGFLGAQFCAVSEMRVTVSKRLQ